MILENLSENKKKWNIKSSIIIKLLVNFICDIITPIRFMITF